ncbi:hypothetical protein G6O67_008764 [Ophiocordyceps sinensis]|uniref:Uncharacterized protein n=1 Tax=Ophiocordyceps sinensis TaxID=72228 RepID=A0A8H4LQE7_9HYPO|nr:hypothetical protein G6O67_008916 [Ophiocordyceps sinensis]KAF4504153.1 hypothetical protein G6O67_008764 [Ophiocordyceps sinensis]
MSAPQAIPITNTRPFDPLFCSGAKTNILTASFSSARSRTRSSSPPSQSWQKGPMLPTDAPRSIEMAGRARPTWSPRKPRAVIVQPPAPTPTPIIPPTAAANAAMADETRLQVLRLICWSICALNGCHCLKPVRVCSCRVVGRLCSCR